MLGEYGQYPRKPIRGNQIHSKQRKANVLSKCLRPVEAFSNTEEAIKLGIHPRTLYALRNEASSNKWSAVSIGRGCEASQQPRSRNCGSKNPARHHLPYLGSGVPSDDNSNSHAVYLAIAANDQAPVLRHPPLRLFWYSKAVYESGIVETKIDRTNIRIYSAEKTLADCFKYRNKIGIDVCMEALNLYRRPRSNEAGSVEQFAKLCRVQQVIDPTWKQSYDC